jgi:putative flippase GtrA
LKRSAQLAQYGVIGAMATAVHYALMAVLIHQGFTALTSTTAGATLGAVVAYIANRKWTFKARHTSRRMVRFLLVASFGLFLNGFLLVTIQYWLISSLIIAQLLTTGLVFLVTFFINLKWSFT